MKIPADYLLEHLHLKIHLLVHHWFQMVGSVINTKTLKDSAPFFPDIQSKGKKIHPLPKVNHGEENVNFRKPIRIEEDAIRCRGRWNYANVLGNSQSCFQIKKYAKRAVL
ncbi:uncharacterized protein TNCV_4873321 [Trichonephila clavipes]|nr:uncharacterized protein TNCV_4873321 [Trichonephila clavipes]